MYSTSWKLDAQNIIFQIYAQLKRYYSHKRKTEGCVFLGTSNILDHWTLLVETWMSNKARKCAWLRATKDTRLRCKIMWQNYGSNQECLNESKVLDEVGVPPNSHLWTEIKIHTGDVLLCVLCASPAPGSPLGDNAQYYPQRTNSWQWREYSICPKVWQMSTRFYRKN